jgi:hypothetical protein
MLVPLHSNLGAYQSASSRYPSGQRRHLTTFDAERPSCCATSQLLRYSKVVAPQQIAMLDCYQVDVAEQANGLAVHFAQTTGETLNCGSSFRGASCPRAGIHNHCQWLWFPDSLAEPSSGGAISHGRLP